ncbi:MAG: SDR family NAD(P)-dependent oxidoreductase [Verrucomicrobia bacterium]|nr:SDR family NAD(P)-dependent oxidoreductase [Verrucomicrobiota bacterium]
MKFPTHDCTAIITGASSGLGAEFARQLAPTAKTLILVARRLEAMEVVKAELQALKADLRVELVVADLSTDEGRAALVSWVGASSVKPNLLINNAGLGDYGSFASASEERLKMQIDVNVSALVLLSRALLPVLMKTAPAGILNVSSLASTLPMPDLAVYAASKSFVSSFSEALAIELEPHQIQVTYVCPGPTPTNFSKTAKREDGTDTNRDGQGLLRIPASQVVAQALSALSAGKTCVFPGLGVSIAAPLFWHMPRSLMRWVLRRRHSEAKV